MPLASWMVFRLVSEARLTINLLLRRLLYVTRHADRNSLGRSGSKVESKERSHVTMTIVSRNSLLRVGEGINTRRCNGADRTVRC